MGAIDTFKMGARTLYEFQDGTRTNSDSNCMRDRSFTAIGPLLCDPYPAIKAGAQWMWYEGGEERGGLSGSSGMQPNGIWWWYGRKSSASLQSWVADELLASDMAAHEFQLSVQYSEFGRGSSASSCVVFEQSRKKFARGVNTFIAANGFAYGSTMSWELCLHNCKVDPYCRQTVWLFFSGIAHYYNTGACFPMSEALDEEEVEPVDKSNFKSAHCTHDGNVGTATGSLDANGKATPKLFHLIKSTVEYD